jgi:hypothetical protein
MKYKSLIILLYFGYTLKTKYKNLMIFKKKFPSLLAIQNQFIFEVSISLFGKILPGKKRLVLPCLLPPGHYPILSDCAIY